VCGRSYAPRQENERSQNSLRLLEADVDLPAKAAGPAERCAGEALRSLVGTSQHGRLRDDMPKKNQLF
jgi:hypothetical protein